VPTTRRLNVSLREPAALSVARIRKPRQDLVYILCARRKLRYNRGRSRIVYIGKTGRGLNRITESVAERAPKILALHGVASFAAHVLTATQQTGVKSALKLERALLIAFRDRFGSVPKCNSKGQRMKAADEFTVLFARSRIEAIIDDLS